jgi:hypothetical protein
MGQVSSHVPSCAPLSLLPAVRAHVRERRESDNGVHVVLVEGLQAAPPWLGTRCALNLNCADGRGTSQQELADISCCRSPIPDRTQV